MSGPEITVERFAARLRRRARVRRACTAAIFALAAVSSGGIVLSCLAIMGWAASPRVGVTVLVLAGTGASFMALVAGALSPPSLTSIVHSADRRGLDGALATALEFSRSEDPFCRLLVRRTASRLETIPIESMASLRPSRATILAPALFAFAVALQVFASPREMARPSTAFGPNTSLGRLSHDLQASASRILVENGAQRGIPVEKARQLLGIEEAVRSGAMSLPAARAALERWLDSVPRPELDSRIPGSKSRASRPSPGISPDAKASLEDAQTSFHDAEASFQRVRAEISEALMRAQSREESAFSSQSDEALRRSGPEAQGPGAPPDSPPGADSQGARSSMARPSAPGFLPLSPTADTIEGSFGEEASLRAANGSPTRGAWTPHASLSPAAAWTVPPPGRDSETAGASTQERGRGPSRDSMPPAREEPGSDALTSYGRPPTDDERALVAHYLRILGDRGAKWRRPVPSNSAVGSTHGRSHLHTSIQPTTPLTPLGGRIP